MYLFSLKVVKLLQDQRNVVVIPLGNSKLRFHLSSKGLDKISSLSAGRWVKKMPQFLCNITLEVWRSLSPTIFVGECPKLSATIGKFGCNIHILR